MGLVYLSQSCIITAADILLYHIFYSLSDSRCVNDNVMIAGAFFCWCVVA